MADILPVPDNLIIYHGILKVVLGFVSLIFFILLIPKYLKKKSKISGILLFTFFFMAIGMMFSSFDNILNWDSLLGEETWLGFGLGQIFNGLANVSFVALYIEIFLVKENWQNKHYTSFLIYTSLVIISSVSIMTYYAFDWPSK